MTASIPFSSEDGAPDRSSAETKAQAAKLSMLDGRTDTRGGMEQQRSRPTSPGEAVAITPAPAEPQPSGQRALPSRSRYPWPAPGLATRLIEHRRVALKDSLIAAVAAVLAWILAHFLFGHPRPLFAAVTAIVCLASGLTSHGKQSLGVPLGVFTGIVVGELVLQLPEHTVLLQIAPAAFLAMVMASLYGQAAVVPINAGVSAILVIAMGPTYAGYARLLDVAIGSSAAELPALPAHTDLAEDSGWHSSNQYLSDVRSALEAFERTGTATRQGRIVAAGVRQAFPGRWRLHHRLHHRPCPRHHQQPRCRLQPPPWRRRFQAQQEWWGCWPPRRHQPV